MTPQKLSRQLARIASSIEHTPNPSKGEVTRKLTSLLASLNQEAMPSSSAGKKMLKHFLDEAGQALDDGDEAAFKKTMEKISKHM